MQNVLPSVNSPYVLQLSVMSEDRVIRLELGRHYFFESKMNNDYLLMYLKSSAIRWAGIAFKRYMGEND